MSVTAEESEPPQNPTGPYEPVASLDPRKRAELIAEIERLPKRLREAAAGLGDAELDTRYRNWTVRQIMHHVADSHANGYIRHRLALTEERPTIKPYDESRWSMLDDAVTGPIEPSLMLIESLHDRWVRLLRSLPPDQFDREYFHPEAGRYVSLDESLGNYAWHGRHHASQIEWLRDRYGW